MKKSATIIYLAVAVIFLCTGFSFAQSSRPIVTNISASPHSSTRVKISWSLPSDKSQIKSLLLFRSTQPYATKSQLADTAPIAKLKPDTIAYTDKLNNYKEYYYAVIVLLQNDERYDIILPSINATVNGVRVTRILPKQKTSSQTESAKEKIYADGEMREQPLPYLDIIENQGKEPGKFSETAYGDAKDLAKGHTETKAVPLDPYIFEDDMVSPPGGDDYFLFEILRTYFIRKRYEESSSSIKKLLSVNRSEGVTKRAVFYLGESLYFCGDYPEALTFFLQVEDEYPVLAKKWIESLLSLYKLPPDAVDSN